MTRIAMIDNKSNISTKRQSELLDLNRTSLYYNPKERSVDSCIANIIYEIWLSKPFYGYRKITALLLRLGHIINHKTVLRIMREMGIQALYPKPKLSKKSGQVVHPYLLKEMIIDLPNQVWATDITYIKLPSGFVYLIAFIDIYSRHIQSWSISNTMDAYFCLDALKSGLCHYEAPSIINTDQGSQFTSTSWVEYLVEQNIKISMDGVGRWSDNIYIERLWRTIKHEHLCFYDVTSIKELTESIKQFVYFYNNERVHQSLCYATPNEVYHGIKNAKPLIHYSVR